ncbi:MAG: hypothetical protein RIF34_06740 [Candidatus Kapaibacterium sp.]
MKDIILVILALLIGMAITRIYYPNQIINHSTDTLTIVQEPIVIEKIKPKLIYKSDTIIQTQPFTAWVDTIYKYDTIHVRYDYPENEMMLAIRMATDTVYKEREIITSEPQKEPWWEDPLIATGGLVLGYLLSNTSK